MINAYSQLIQDTLRFMKELPEGTFELTSPEQSAYFPHQPPVKQTIKPIQIAIPSAPPPRTPEIVVRTQPTPVARPTSLSIESPKPPTPAAIPSVDLRAALHKIAPHLPLTDRIPDDAIAQRVASAWQEKIPEVDVVLLLLDSAPESIEFLKNLGKAIHTQLAPAKVISGTRLEQEKKWDLFFEKNPLRLILATEGMHNFPQLQSFYTALPAQGQAFLNQIPLITLAPAVSYAQSPDQKIALWKRLCQILKS